MGRSLEAALKGDLRNRCAGRLQLRKPVFKARVEQDFRKSKTRFCKPAPQSCFTHRKMLRHLGEAP